MKILVYLPIDTLMKNWARRLQADGHEVEITHTFSVFRKRSAWADWTLMNSAKNDSPKYIWKILLSLLYARVRRRRLALLISIDPVDLCDRPILRAVLWAMNRVALRCPALVMLLATRGHIARRYGIPQRKIFFVHSCPDRERFAPGRPAEAGGTEKPLTFFYHGEMLWWHGLERFIPVYEEVRKQRSARLVVAGTLYPTVFRVFGLAASRREVAVKRRLAALIERDDVEYCGHVSFEQLRRNMVEADFHATLFNDEDMQARTELRTCLLEAMAAGMVCLHAPTPALTAGIFRDGENIVTINPRDPEGAAKKILALAASPDTLEAIRRNAVRTIEEHFDFESQYWNLLARLGASRLPER